MSRRSTRIVVIAALLTLVADSRAASGACPAFAAPVPYGVGIHPESVAIADLNGDAKLDLAVANHDSNNVSILLGNGDGTFAAALNYAAGHNPASVAIGDFNGDDAPDLVVVNPSVDNAVANIVSILLANGDGTFAAPVGHAVGKLPQSVAIGDFNGDGKLDLAVATFSTGPDNFPDNIWVFLGNGNGTFASPTRYPGGSGPVHVASGDVNADGKIDLAIASSPRIRSISILLGNGDGTFVVHAGYNPGSAMAGPWSVAIGDLNGDAKPDLAVPDGSRGLWVLPGNGDGTFGAAVSHAAASQPGWVAIGDVNGDGKADLAITNGVSATVSILHGGGDGSFAPAVSYPAGNPAATVVMGDVNRDSKPDLVVRNRDASTVSILLNTTDCTPPPIVAPAITSQPSSLIVHAGATVTLSASASGTPAPTVQWQFSTTSGATWIDLAVGTSNTYVFTAAVGDSARQFRAIFTNAGGTAATAPAGLTVTSDRPFVADIDGDGKSDLILWRPTNGTWYALTSTSGYSASAAVGVQWGSQVQGDVPLLGDIDGDTRSDFIVWRASTGTWYWLTSSSGYNTAMAGSKQWGNVSLGDVPLAGDVDGDGNADLIVWRASTGTWHWLTSSKGYAYDAQGHKQWGNNGLGDVPIVGDVDGDGKSDLTVWRASTGTWYWLTSSSVYSASDSVQWGSAAYLDARFLRDIDGDGRADPIVWRPGDGTWHWLTSSSGYSYGAQGQKQWGREGDTPLAPTIDGDSEADLAVWRPSNGTWFWLTSSTGFGYDSAGARNWGSATATVFPVQRAAKE